MPIDQKNDTEMGQNNPNSSEYQKMVDRVPLYLESHKIPEKYFAYWDSEAIKQLDKYKGKFESFKNGNEALINAGDRILISSESTGYNILLNQRDMDVASDQPLVFYNCHAGRTWHFGLLLAEMQKNGLITPKDVTFGSKATKVMYDGSWPLIEEDELEGKILKVDNIYEQSVVETVETVLTFSTHANKLVNILEYLRLNTDAEDNKDCVPGSWYIQDIRATLPLSPILGIDGTTKFQTITSNVVRNRNAILLALRENTGFTEEYYETIQNLKLVKFLTEFGVPK